MDWLLAWFIVSIPATFLLGRMLKGCSDEQFQSPTVLVSQRDGAPGDSLREVEARTPDHSPRH